MSARKETVSAAETAEFPIIGSSSALKRVIEFADSVASNNCTVLLNGETGTGKELVARRIHEQSQRSGNSFIPVNCPAVTESLFESQFFGHVKGSFTGAEGDTLGMVRAAENGTLFLDEIGELPIHIQPKLLRLLQEKEVTPVGSPQTYNVDVRFIAATNRPLEDAISAGEFRSDLFHRLNIASIEIPPLRHRQEDIEELLDFYLDHFAMEYGREEIHIDSRVRATLAEYHWPGNIRELSCWVERLYATGLPATPPSASRRPATDSCRMPKTLAEIEADAISHVLASTGNNRSEAAGMLDIHRTTLLRKMKQYDIV